MKPPVEDAEGRRANLPVDPWCLREQTLDLEHLGQTESLFAVSNGNIGLRGTFDEREPHDTHGTYLAGFFENRPLPYPEGGYGYPESGQTIVDVTNGKSISLLVDDEPFDVRYGTTLAHQRKLDLRAGTLKRRVEWVSPAGKRVKIRSTRLASFAHRSVVAIAYVVEAVEPVRIILQSELVANEAAPQPSSDDPRVAAALERPLLPESQDVEQSGAVLVHRTRSSGLRVGAGMDHDVECDAQFEVENEAREDWARTTVVTVLEPGDQLRVVKYLAYGWSARRSVAAMRDQIAAALTSARYAGWGTLKRNQREFLDDFWETADVVVDGDPVIQQAVRFALFQVLQAGARTEGRAIGAKGLTGTGYSGHAFWDVEGFVLPVLMLTMPEAANHALRWRASTLDRARRRARLLGLRGAAFPWRTIDGDETSAYWPAGTAAVHVNGDIARAFEEYRLITGDVELEREHGVDVLVETARLWASLGHHDRHGWWHLDGVTGPDEYSGVSDDNVFTNLVAAANLRSAADACLRNREKADELGVTAQELTAWWAAADAVYLPFDEELGMHPQSENFTRQGEWDFDTAEYPLLLHAPYFQLYRRQVTKQADLVLAMHWFPDAFTAEEKARNLDYYERRTVRDSSLSACTQAVVCAQAGQTRLAYAYLHEAALVDLHDINGNTRHGLHIASLAGAWTALVEGFGGLRRDGELMRLEPVLPEPISRLAFGVRWRGHRVRVEITHDGIEVSLPGQDDAELVVFLYDERVELTGATPVRRPLRARRPLLPEPTQPPGRAPRPPARVSPPRPGARSRAR
ncbi:MAG: glycoside hydrolase family 65 protein [Georgenia sp.]